MALIPFSLQQLAHMSTTGYVIRLLPAVQQRYYRTRTGKKYINSREAMVAANIPGNNSTCIHKTVLINYNRIDDSDRTRTFFLLATLESTVKKPPFFKTWEFTYQKVNALGKIVDSINYRINPTIPIVIFIVILVLIKELI